MKKFGSISQEPKDRLQKLNSIQLDARFTAWFELTTTEDLRVWLAQTAALHSSN